MCGIVGVWGDFPDPRKLVENACSMLRHRGPDDVGTWAEEAVGLAVGHTRLSVLDLSPAGHQPMASLCGRYVIVFNGEIYNHLELRKDVERAQGRTCGGLQGGWRGHSDTETLLACITEWGIERTLRVTVGMFALALWDRNNRALYLARDRMGEKPLYYGKLGHAFAFGSELKALTAFPGFPGDVDRRAIALLMRHNYVPGPYSIYRGIAKLPPGTWLKVSAEAVTRHTIPAPQAYWSPLEQATRGGLHQLSFQTDTDAAHALEEILRTAVTGQMVADVPLGAFLSGGIDSSTVVALMQSQSKRPVKTFSIGFQAEGYDEAHHAKAVARHLGTDHTELYVSASDALAIIPRLPEIYDEPFSDSSQIPTHLVARLARQHVTVALSGDGGDELFGGYNRYIFADRMWKVIEAMPGPARKLAASLLLATPPAAWNWLHVLFKPLTPRGLRLTSPGDAIHKGARLLSAPSGSELYRGLVSHWEPSEIVLGEHEPDSIFAPASLQFPRLTETMMALDAANYLPDDILVKVDRAAMAVSLETRAPLLDHRVFEFAWRLPMRYKIRDGVGKWLLRRVLDRYVPARLVDRPKMGFGVPIGSWLRGPLRPWAEDLLDEARLRREGYLKPAPIHRRWAEHVSGKRNWQHHLWDVLMFQAWLQRQRA